MECFQKLFLNIRRYFYAMQFFGELADRHFQRVGERDSKGFGSEKMRGSYKMKKARKLVALLLVLLMVLTVPMLSTMAADLIAIRVVVQPRLEFDDVFSFSENMGRMKSYDKYGFTDTSGKEILPAIYDGAGSFSDGLACVVKNRKFGFIDTTGALKIPYIYDYAESFVNGYAIVEKRYGNPRDGQYHVGLINKDGVEVIPCEYNEIYPYSAADFDEWCEDGMVTLTKWNDVTWIGSNGFFDLETGSIIVEASANVGEYSQGLYSFRSGGKWGYKNKAGEMKVPYEYDRAFPFSSSGYAEVWKDGKCGLVDKTGTLVLPCEYTYVDADSVAEGYAVASKEAYDDEYEFPPLRVVSLTTKDFAFAKSYDTISPFNGGLAVAIDGLTCAYIDTAGTERYSLPFDDWTMENYLFPFYEGRNLTTILKDGKMGLINRNFEIVVPVEYDLTFEFLGFMEYDDYFIVSKKNQYGLMNAQTGALAIPCQYAHLARTEGNPDVLIAYNDEQKGGLLNLNGNILSSLQYDLIVETLYEGAWEGIYEDLYDWEFNLNYYDEGLLRTYKISESYGYEDEFGFQTGLLGYNGKELLPCRYAYIAPFHTPDSTHAWIFDELTYGFGIVERGVASADAALKSLTVNNGTLSPKFSAGTLNYSVSVGSDVSSLTVKATANHPGAKISGTGKTSLKEGLNTIKVVVTAETGVKKTYTIKVTRAAATKVSKVSVTAPAKDITVGMEQKLTAMVSPTNATNKKVTWKSSNTKVATVDSNGKVTAKGAGKVTLTATAADGSKKSGSVAITVHSYVLLKIGSPTAIQNGRTAKVEAPFILSGTTMVPLRFVSENMGGKVKYVNDQTPIKLTYGNITVEFLLNSKTMKVTTADKSQTVQLSVVPQKKNGKTYIPLRAVSQALGFDVRYEAGTEYIVINNPKMSAAVVKARFAEAKRIDGIVGPAQK